MDFKISSNIDEVIGKLDEHAKRIVRDHNERIAAAAHRLQEACDRVYDEYAGESAETVYEALQTELADFDLEIPDEHIRSYAEAIAERRHVRVEFKRGTI